MRRKVRVSAPGKIILSGEHAVVYGFPAILAAVDRRLLLSIEKSNRLQVVPAKATDIVKRALGVVGKKFKEEDLEKLKVSLNSQIPIGCGMGSSAAFAVGITAGIFELLDQPKNLAIINECAYEIEKKQHGNPSGGDNTIVTYGGFLWYRKEGEGFKIFEKIKPKSAPTLWLINSGKPQENTGEMVAKVKDFYQQNPARVRSLFFESEKLTRAFLELLQGEKSYSLIDLLKENEAILDSLGVVSPKARRIIQKIEQLGGGAKVSGAGGIKNGSGIILAYHKDADLLPNFAKRSSLEYFKATLGEKGVTEEK